MADKRKILYIEDMKECYKKTSEALGQDFEIDWKKNSPDAINAIVKNLKKYSAVVSDVNLYHNPNLPDNEQTTEGLNLIKIAKEEAERQGISIPIICVSKNGALYEKLSLEAGARRFLYKKEFWEGKGKEVLEELIKKV
jgi:CheY-like chemotaxis protein